MYDVCIADDEALIQQSITLRLKESGTPVRVLGSAGNAESALVLYWSAKPDIFFVDINMPGMDGLSLVRRIREEDPGCSTKFIIITGYDDFAHLREAIQSGVTDYLKKPIATEEFNTVLEAAAKQILQERNKRDIPRNDAPYYEDYIAQGNRTLSGGVLLALYAPSAETFITKETDDIAAAFLSKGGSVSLNFQNVKNIRLWYRPGRDIARRDLALFFRPLVERMNASIVYAYPAMERLELLTERIEQSLNARFIHPGLIECIEKPLLFSADTGMLDYALENGETEGACRALSALISRAGSGIQTAGELSPLYRQIILLLINKYISHNLPMPGHLKLELAPFALCRFPGLETLRAFLCGTATALTKSTGGAGQKGDLIQGALDYLKQNYRNEISLNFLANQFFVTPPYLSRRFKEKTGLTFVEHLEEIRLEKAEEYLVSSEIKITDISEQVGYMDPNYFAKVFKKKYRLSPSDYRFAYRQH